MFTFQSLAVVVCLVLSFWLRDCPKAGTLLAAHPELLYRGLLCFCGAQQCLKFSCRGVASTPHGLFSSLECKLLEGRGLLLVFMTTLWLGLDQVLIEDPET